MITVRNGRLVQDCIHCECGFVEVTPDPTRPWRTQRRHCDRCSGGYALVLCAYCGEPADVIDHGVPKCAASWREDHPGQTLPASDATARPIPMYAEDELRKDEDDGRHQD